MFVAGGGAARKAFELKKCEKEEIVRQKEREQHRLERTNTEKDRHNAAMLNVSDTAESDGGRVSPSEKVIPSDVPLEDGSVKRFFKDPDKHTGLFRNWILKSAQVESVTVGESFNGFIIVVICIAGALVGVQNYDLDPETISTLAVIDNIILTIFCIECIMKMMAEGLEPWRYFTGPEWAWNNFDFIIVFLCLPTGILSEDDSSSVALLRLFRLARVAKLIKKIPQLQMIVMGLVGGFKSISYILGLLILVFYLYAILGMFLYKENDPLHFGHVPIAMITLFRMSTLEDWTDVMYINYYGCYEGGNFSETRRHIFRSGFYTDVKTKANDVTLFFCNETIADSRPLGEITMLYFISFIMISALVMLSLFIGAVTMSMTESMESMKHLANKTKKDVAMSKFKATTASVAEDGDANESASGSAVDGSHEDPEASQVEPEPQPEDARTAEQARNQRRMRHLLLHAFGVEEDDAPDESSGDSADGAQSGEGDTTDKRNPVFRGYSWLANHCYEFANSKVFERGIMIVIIWAGIMVGLGTDDEFTASNEAVLVPIEALILYIFILEAVVKIVACDFQPWEYIYKAEGGLQGWNCFDMMVIMGSALPGDSQSIVVVLRLLRLLRVLKLVRSLPALQVIVVALIKATMSISYVAIILLMFFYMAGILGMILFKENDPIHFGHLSTTIISLFRCSTLEDWTDVMYINAYGCRYYGYGGLEDLCYCDPRRKLAEEIEVGTMIGDVGAQWADAAKAKYFTGCGSWASFLFFLFFTIVGALVLMTLFIGIVTTSMDEAKAAQAERQDTESQLTEFQEEVALSDSVVQAYRQVFAILDIDDGGSIEEDELDLGLTSIGIKLSFADLTELIFTCTGNSTGELSLADFCKLMYKMQQKCEAGEFDQISGNSGWKSPKGTSVKSPLKSSSKETEDVHMRIAEAKEGPSSSSSKEAPKVTAETKSSGKDNSGQSAKACNSEGSTTV